MAIVTPETRYTLNLSRDEATGLQKILSKATPKLLKSWNLATEEMVSVVLVRDGLNTVLPVLKGDGSVHQSVADDSSE